MNGAKIALSKEELELVTNAGWILTKNLIIEKVKHLLGKVQNELEQAFPLFQSLPPGIFQPGPKISRGENYRGLPWLVLDYPRYFDKEDSFALRNFFWWGNFFSTTLQLSGSYQSSCRNALNSSLTQLQSDGFFLCVNEDRWEHHFDDGNYISFQKIGADTFEALLTAKPFVKIAKKFPLESWDEVSFSMSRASITLLKFAGC